MQGIADRVESGEDRDLRWIDLPADCQRCVFDGLNIGFGAFIEAAPAFATRDEAGNYDGIWLPNDRDPLPIYRDGDLFLVKDSDREYEGEPDNDFPTFREALLYILPDDYTLAGPEYHTTVDLWDEMGGPAPLWDCYAEPATPFEVQPWAIAKDKLPLCLDVIAEARDPDHAKEIGDAWRLANPELAKEYEPAYINKVERVVHRMT